jgi:nifR3 family TIM-barrel protein
MLDTLGVKYDLLDFNAACPAKKLALKGAGAGMMKTPANLEEAIRLLVKYAPVPVTTKIRTGWDERSVNAVDIARRCQGAGVHAVFVHGRTRDQGYRGGVDYETISEVKRSLAIPVIGSGDIWSAESARRMFERTGCDGIAIARGALGNPWVFPELMAMFDGVALPPRPAALAVVQTVLRHAAENVRIYGEPIGVMRFRKHLGWYLKGLPCARNFRAQAFRVSTLEELKEFLGGMTST